MDKKVSLKTIPELKEILREARVAISSNSRKAEYVKKVLDNIDNPIIAARFGLLPTVSLTKTPSPLSAMKPKTPSPLLPELKPKTPSPLLPTMKPKTPSSALPVMKPKTPSPYDKQKLKDNIDINDLRNDFEKICINYFR